MKVDGAQQVEIGVDGIEFIGPEVGTGLRQAQRHTPGGPVVGRGVLGLALIAEAEFGADDLAARIAHEALGDTVDRHEDRRLDRFDRHLGAHLVQGEFGQQFVAHR